MVGVEGALKEGWVVLELSYLGTLGTRVVAPRVRFVADVLKLTVWGGGR